MKGNRKTLWLTAAAFAMAALAIGQNAELNSAGPTRNDYRLRVSEPREGATVSGSTLQVVVNTEIPGENADERRTTSSMPRPDVDVFLDGANKGMLKDRNNVLTIEGLAPGEHKLVLLAMNRSGEVIDRKEIHFASTAAVVAETSTATTRTTTTTAQSQIPERPAQTYEPPSQAPSARKAYEPPPEPARPSALPQTGTAYPLLGAAGVVLTLAGLSLKRRG